MSSEEKPSTSKKENLIYAGIVLLIIIALVAVWRSQNDPRTAELNNILNADNEISSFSFPFRVFSVSDNTAFVATPRSAQMSVLRFLEISMPQLDVSQPDTKPVIDAQKELARIQSKVQNVILSHPGIDDVQWQLDKQWYLKHGVIVQ